MEHTGGNFPWNDVMNLPSQRFCDGSCPAAHEKNPLELVPPTLTPFLTLLRASDSLGTGSSSSLRGCCAHGVPIARENTELINPCIPIPACRKL